MKQLLLILILSLGLNASQKVCAEQTLNYLNESAIVKALLDIEGCDYAFKHSYFKKQTITQENIGEESDIELIKVTILREGLLDDSIKAEKYVLDLEEIHGVFFVTKRLVYYQCARGELKEQFVKKGSNKGCS